MIHLHDDGTLDTVLVCSNCNEVFRGTYNVSVVDTRLKRVSRKELETIEALKKEFSRCDCHNCKKALERLKGEVR